MKDTLRVRLSCLALFLGCAACSDDGGSGGGTSPPGSGQVPAMVGYGLRDTGTPLQVGFAYPSPVAGGTPFELSLFLEGSYVFQTHEYTVDAGSDLLLETGPLFGAIEVIVTRQAIALGTTLPTAGEIMIHRLANGDLVTLAVDPTIAPNGGVNLSFDQFGDGTIDETASYPWETVQALFGGLGLEWEQIAGLVVGIFQLANDRLAMAVETFAFVYVNEMNFESSGPGVDWDFLPCGSGPGGITGSAVLRWLDVNASTRVDSSDEFMAELTDCWIDEPNSTVDRLFDGAFAIEDFFESASGFGVAGIVAFDSFRTQKTIEAPAGVINLDPFSEVTTDGSLEVHFTE